MQQKSLSYFIYGRRYEKETEVRFLARSLQT